VNVASSWIVRDRKDDTAVTGCLAQSHESNLSPLRQSFLNEKMSVGLKFQTFPSVGLKDAGDKSISPIK
jgi:hypothetical protein